MKNKYFKKFRKFEPRGIQPTIMTAFSVVSISIMMLTGIVMYIRFSDLSRQEMIRSTQKLMEQTEETLENYLANMRRVSDAAYYNVIKENDFADSGNDIQKGMNLLYEANRDNLRSIAIYNNYGSLMAAEPVELRKKAPDVTGQAWFEQAIGEVENMHFSAPHIQNLFEDAAFRYDWVITLSRAAEIIDKGVPVLGVLLVDMDYSGIFRMLKQMNSQNNGQYYYLCDSRGEIIYHPHQIRISDGICSENSIYAAKFRDGVYNDFLDGEQRKIVVNAVSYTGWRLVGVIPYSAFTLGMLNIRYFVALIILVMVVMLVFINRMVSRRISSPIMKLNDSVVEYEAGATPEIYVGGSLEIRHLALSIQNSYEQIDTLMKKIVQEQNERRKSELDALQSQINPHFLYNTLDSITWMIEGERNDEAVFMISQLAKLFRISLSGGRTVITVRDEVQHARSYMNIQKVRYKEAFAVSFRVEPEVYDFCTVKLILQPILENAINYGMCGMDESGEIVVRGWLEDRTVILTVEDNGMGMSEEVAAAALADSNRAHAHGSGVGLMNINNRIQILFGKEYGLIAESEPDEGTIVSIRLPAIPYTEENRRKLEKGFGFTVEELRKDTGGK